MNPQNIADDTSITSELESNYDNQSSYLMDVTPILSNKGFNDFSGHVNGLKQKNENEPKKSLNFLVVDDSGYFSIFHLKKNTK